MLGALAEARAALPFISTTFAKQVEHRRLEDTAPGVVVAVAVSDSPAATTGQQPAGPSIHVIQYGPVPLSGYSDKSPSETPLFVLDTGAGDMLCVSGAELRRWPRPPGSNIAQVAAREAESMRARHAASLRKRKFDEGFVVFVEQTNRVESEVELHDALLLLAPDLLGVFGAVLLLPSGTDGQVTRLRAIPHVRIAATLEPLDASAVLPRPAPAPITPAETAPGKPFAGLAPLFSETRATQLVSVPLGERALLVLVERRSDREFSGEDWFRMQTVARHADRVLERLELKARLEFLLSTARQPS
jgi:hypothetical protein